jgi:hypothetical protein
VERAFVHVDYLPRDAPEHKARPFASVCRRCARWSAAACVYARTDARALTWQVERELLLLADSASSASVTAASLQQRGRSSRTTLDPAALA